MYIPSLKSQILEEHPNKKFLEYDKTRNQIYDNLYLHDCKVVVKVSILQNSDSKEIVEIEPDNFEEDLELLMNGPEYFEYMKNKVIEEKEHLDKMKSEKDV